MRTSLKWTSKINQIHVAKTHNKKIEHSEEYKL